MVADFGVALIQNHLTSSAISHHTSTKEGGGTLRWMAPELLVGDPLKKSCDLYSFAITAWELFSNGKIPFSAVPDLAIYNIVGERKKRPSRPASLESDDLWTIICRCWFSDPEKRPIFSDVQRRLKTLCGTGKYLF